MLPGCLVKTGLCRMLLPGWQQNTCISVPVHLDTFLFVKRSVSHRQNNADDAQRCADRQRQITSISAACHNRDESHLKKDAFKRYLAGERLIYVKQLSGKNAFIYRCQGVYLFIYPATDGRIMCLCRDLICWFCLVRSFSSEWHKSGLHYTIKGPLMRRACEHDGCGEDEQSFEGQQSPVYIT